MLEMGSRQRNKELLEIHQKVENGCGRFFPMQDHSGQNRN